MTIYSFSIPFYFFTFNNFVYCHSFIECKKSLAKYKIIRYNTHHKIKLIKNLGLLLIIHMIKADIKTEHLKYKMKMGIKSEKKYQDFEIEYRLAV